MISASAKTFLAIVLVATAVIAPMAGGAHAQPASANDTARLLAGMQPSPDSPLLAMTRDRAWQQHANHFNAIFAKVENHQLSRIQAWSRAKLTSPSPVLFYMFSGPDFLYANALFPNASTYVMSGLEPTGSDKAIAPGSGTQLPQHRGITELDRNLWFFPDDRHAP
jgi:hypothetical protein